MIAMHERRDPRVARRTDSGFSLLEVLVSLGIFSILMATVATVLIFGLRSFLATSDANSLQAQQQNALTAISRLVRFIDNPDRNPTPTAAILTATPTTLGFHTRGAGGVVDRIPIRAAVCLTDDGIVEVTWPIAVPESGVPVEPEAYSADPVTCATPGGNRRILVPITDTNVPSLTFRYWRERTPLDPAGDGAVEIIAPNGLSAADAASVTRIDVSITDSTVAIPVEQQIALVNAR